MHPAAKYFSSSKGHDFIDLDKLTNYHYDQLSALERKARKRFRKSLTAFESVEGHKIHNFQTLCQNVSIPQATGSSNTEQELTNVKDGQNDDTNPSLPSNTSSSTSSSSTPLPHHHHQRPNPSDPPHLTQNIAPSEVLCLLNTGFGLEVKDPAIIEEICLLFGPCQALCSPSHPFCYVSFTHVKDAELCLSTLQGRFIPLFQCSTFPLFLGFIDVEKMKLLRPQHPLLSLRSGVNIYDSMDVPGLSIYENFITEEEEEALINYINTQPWESLVRRRVQHYGRTFDYSLNRTNDISTAPFPEVFSFVLDRITSSGAYVGSLDQLTINDYNPGDGIPSHVDTHSAFTDSIISLSLCSTTVMEFRKLGNPDDMVLKVLPRRSLTVMADESRYGWEHYISQRRFDTIAGVVIPREHRVSLTFREVHQSICECDYPELCDSQIDKTIKKKW